MRGKKRTKEEQHELIEVLEEYLEMGFSLKRASSLAGVPYSSVRDIVSILEPLRASVTAAQNRVNVVARRNIISSIEKGNVNDSKWWLERLDRMEVIIDPVYGSAKEALMNGARYPILSPYMSVLRKWPPAPFPATGRATSSLAKRMPQRSGP